MLFEQVIGPAIDSMALSKVLPREGMQHPILRCSLSCIGANESSENPDAIDSDISLNKMVPAF